MKNNDQTPEFVIKAPFLEDLVNEIRHLRSEVDELKNNINPRKEYYTLKGSMCLEKCE